MFFIIVAPFLGGIGIDLYVPSLPTIKNEFNVDHSLVQFTITTYLLGYAIGQLFLGILSDSFGRKKILYFSSIFYVFTTILAIVSQNIYFRPPDLDDLRGDHFVKKSQFCPRKNGFSFVKNFA
ncbi:MAG: MFS transporter [Chlamydiae bacterium]|nr:MFS transporter [Chlamydiota bacterium]